MAGPRSGRRTQQSLLLFIAAVVLVTGTTSSGSVLPFFGVLRPSTVAHPVTGTASPAMAAQIKSLSHTAAVAARRPSPIHGSTWYHRGRVLDRLTTKQRYITPAAKEPSTRSALAAHNGASRALRASAVASNDQQFGPANWGFADSAQNPPQYPQNGNPPFWGPTDTLASSQWIYVGNEGSSTWLSSEGFGVGYHVYDGAENALIADGPTTPLGTDVAPGDSTWVNASIAAMGGSGSSLGLPEASYVLRWDVNESGTWLSAAGVDTADFHILVSSPPAPASPNGGSPLNTLTPSLTASSCRNSDGSSNGLCTPAGRSSQAGYQFQITSDPSFGGYITSSGWLSMPSWQVPTGALQPGTMYYWRVMGRDQYSASTGWSDKASLTTAGVPSPPSAVIASYASGSSGSARAVRRARARAEATMQTGSGASPVTVSWTAPTSDGGTPITAYVVTPYLNAVPQSPIIAGGSATTVTLNGLTGAGSYTFTVAAVNAIGTSLISDYSGSIYPGVPGTPGNVTAIPGDQQVVVAWTPPAPSPSSSTTSPDVTGYVVTTYLSGQSVAQQTMDLSSTATHAVVSQGITDGIPYTFAVAAFNPAGQGATSPQTAAVIAGASPSVTATFNRAIYARGASAVLSTYLTPAGGSAEAGDQLLINLQPAASAWGSTLDPTGSLIRIAGKPCSAAGAVCTISSSAIKITGLTVPAAGLPVTATLRALGDDGGCAFAYSGTFITDAKGNGGLASAAAQVCDSALGIQPWWSFTNTPTGPDGLAQVNVADGNLVLSQRDSTVFQLHGHLTLGTSRTYNSATYVYPGVFPDITGAEPLGQGWTTSWVSAGDQLGGTALRLSSDENATAGQAVTLITDSGARVVFAATDLQTSIDVTTLMKTAGGTSGPLGPLVLTSPTGSAVSPTDSAYVPPTSTTYTQLCVDTVYASEPGVHASMWRYVEATASVASCAHNDLNATHARVFAYATMTTDRVLRVFSSDGRLLWVRDAEGNRVDLSYVQIDSNYNHQHLVRVSETGGSGRTFTLDYSKTWVSGSTTLPEVDVTDPAKRVTKYQEDSAGRLLNVINPGGSGTLQYQYPSSSLSCGGGANQLCELVDPRGGNVKINYTAGASTGWPAVVAQIIDRAGTATTFSYSINGFTTVDTPNVSGGAGERKLFTSIDPNGRVGELDEGDINSNWLRKTITTWDSAATGTFCRQPDSAQDNDRCTIIRRALNGGVTPDRITNYRYNDEGAVLIQNESASPNVVTTEGYAAQYVEASSPQAPSGSVRAFTDTIQGANSVASGSAGRRDSTTVFVISDRVAQLTPNGNAATVSASASYETSYTVDATSSVGAGLPIGSTPACSGGVSSLNTGSTCNVTAPSKDGVHPTVTTYSYDQHGQRLTKSTPDEYAKTVGVTCESGASTAGYQYLYYGDTVKDLSNTTPAGGWLKAVVDPCGNFVAYAYDAAGNVVRTWDRDATAGLNASDSISNFPATYSQTIYTSFNSPWRYVTSSRDALGNTITYEVDRAGNRWGTRSARGNQAASSVPSCPNPDAPSQTPGPFDTCSTYDSNDHLLQVQRPAEAAQHAATVNQYDEYGNLTVTTDPDKIVTTYSYDAVNRQIAKHWTRGSATSMPAPQVPSECHTTTSSSDPPYPANEILCTTTTTYDGVDNTTASGDGVHKTSAFRFDAVHRMVSMITPRYDGSYQTLHTDMVYDQDGNLTDKCPPREFVDGKSTKCTGSGYFSAHNTYDDADQLVSSARYLGYVDSSGAPCPSGQTVYTCALGSTTYAYDADGNLLSTTDANAHTTTNSYDALGRLRETIVPRDTAGNVSYPTSFGYDPAGNRTWTSQQLDEGSPPTIRDDLVSYDADSRPVYSVVAAEDSSGKPTTIFGQVSTADSSGGSNIETGELYDAEGNVVARFSPRAFVAASPYNQTPTSTAPNPEFMVRTDYDADGRPTAQYVPRYDTADAAISGVGLPVFSGQASQAQDCRTGAQPQTVPGVPAYPGPNNASTTGVCITAVHYDADGRVIQKLPATAGGNWSNAQFIDTYSYTDDGLLYTQITPDPSLQAQSVTTSFQYDVQRNQISATDPLGHVTSYTWSSDHLKLNTTSPPNGSLTHSQQAGYDANGNQINLTDSSYTPPSSGSNTSTPMTLTAYTTNDLRQSVATPAGGAYTTGTQNLDNNPYVTSYQYDRVGNLRFVSSPNANFGDADNPTNLPTEYRYSDDNLLLHTLQPTSNCDNRSIDNTYDGATERTSQHITNSLDSHCSSSVPSDDGTPQYQYYPDGRLKQVLSRNSTTPAKVFTYDADGNQISASSGSSTVQSTYYIDGSLRTTDDGSYQAQWSYDGSGHMATLQTLNDSGGAVGTEAAGYTAAGQANQLATDQYLSNGNPAVEQVSYDSDGRTTRITPTNNNPSDNRAVQRFCYNDDGTLEEQIIGASGCQSPPQSCCTTYTDVNYYSYDADFRLTRSITMSDAGNAVNTGYAYYPDGRVQNDGLIYDHDGNRVQWQPSGNTYPVSYSYWADDSIKQFTTTINTPQGSQPASAQSTYDQDGRLSSDGCWNYVYDGFDRLRTATAVVNSPNSSRPPACGTVPVSDQTTYTYDALDRQLSHSYRSAGITTSWTYSFANTGKEPDVFTYFDRQGTAHQRYAVNNSSGTPVQVEDLTSNAWQWLSGDGKGNLGYVSTDGGAGDCMGAYDFTGAAAGSCQLSYAQQPLQFSEFGYHYAAEDPSTGDYTFGARTYDPSKGAFLSPDSFQPGSTKADLFIGSDPLSADRYNYVNDDPVNLIDPTGHLETCDNGDPTCGGMPCQYTGSCTPCLGNCGGNGNGGGTGTSGSGSGSGSGSSGPGVPGGNSGDSGSGYQSPPFVPTCLPGWSLAANGSCDPSKPLPSTYGPQPILGPPTPTPAPSRTPTLSEPCYLVCQAVAVFRDASSGTVVWQAQAPCNIYCGPGPNISGTVAFPLEETTLPYVNEFHLALEQGNAQIVNSPDGCQFEDYLFLPRADMEQKVLQEWDQRNRYDEASAEALDEAVHLLEILSEIG